MVADINRFSTPGEVADYLQSRGVEFTVPVLKDRSSEVLSSAPPAGGGPAELPSSAAPLAASIELSGLPRAVLGSAALSGPVKSFVPARPTCS